MGRKAFMGGGIIETHCSRAVLVALLIVHGAVSAADPAPQARYHIEQPSQPLADSLRAIATQTGVSVLFDPGAVRGRTSRPVSGQLSASEAIERALEGSGLAVEVLGDGSIVVKAVDALGRQVPVRRVQTQGAVNAGGRVDAGASGALDFAQATQSGSASEPSGSSRADTQQFTTVEVTGSRLKRIDAEGPMPVNTYTRADIDKSGQPTLERFLNSLNEVSVSPGEGSFGSTTGQTSVQLRGLPLGSTLVLINGRRIQAVGSSSADFFNLSLIPLAAVERVEVVPVGSSAVYGGDALAGVVNIILKKSIEGVALDARMASGRGTGDGGFSLATGGRDADGSFLLLGSYSKTTPLTMAERDFFVDADYRRFGGQDARTQGCTPGTVTSSSGSNLPGLSSPVAGIPANAGQPLTISSFAATAGLPNLCNSMANGRGDALVHGEETFGLHGTMERRLGDAWSLFGEATYARDRLSTVPMVGLQLNSVTVPETNPYNPFGVPVKVTSRMGLDNGAEGLIRTTNYTRALVGLRGEFAKGWDVEFTLSTSRDDGDRVSPDNVVNRTALNAALAASDPAAALNPFTAGRAASDDVLRSIWSDNVRQNHGRRDQGSAFVRGSLFELPAGSTEAIAGVEFAHDHYETSLPGTSVIDSRRSNALFGELRMPLLHGGAAGAGWDIAALTLAARRDRYSDFGGANTYQAGLEVRPVRTVLLRASTATSFKPPTLLETSVENQSFSTEDFGLVDPTAGGAPIVGGEVLRTTNTSLKPEQGRAYSLGALWEPESGTRLGVTAWQVRIDGLIALLWPQDTLDNESLFPGFVTRGPSVNGAPGPVTQVLYAEVNFGSVRTAGLDLEATHSWKGWGGKWTVGASATRTTRYDVVIAPGAPTEDRLGRRAMDFWSPKWKGRLAVGLEREGWGIGLTSRYLGGYKDTGTSDRDLGNYWVHDLAGSIDLKHFGWGFGARTSSLSLGIVNVANRMPQYVETAPYYDVTQADWRGRYANLRLSMTW